MNGSEKVLASRLPLVCDFLRLFFYLSKLLSSCKRIYIRRCRWVFHLLLIFPFNKTICLKCCFLRVVFVSFFTLLNFFIWYTFFFSPSMEFVNFVVVDFFLFTVHTHICRIRSISVAWDFMSPENKKRKSYRHWKYFDCFFFVLLLNSLRDRRVLVCKVWTYKECEYEFLCVSLLCHHSLTSVLRKIQLNYDVILCVNANSILLLFTFNI